MYDCVYDHRLLNNLTIMTSLLAGSVPTMIRTNPTNWPPPSGIFGSKTRGGGSVTWVWFWPNLDPKFSAILTIFASVLHVNFFACGGPFPPCKLSFRGPKNAFFRLRGPFPLCKRLFRGLKLFVRSAAGEKIWFCILYKAKPPYKWHCIAPQAKKLVYSTFQSVKSHYEWLPQAKK